MTTYYRTTRNIGHFSSKYPIVLDHTITPVIHAPRIYLIHLKDEIKKEWDKMVKDWVIKKVEEPTDWISSLAYDWKSNGQMRICFNLKDLNRAIKRCRNRVSNPEDMTHKMANAKWFRNLDAQNSYWFFKLDEESQTLICFNSLFSRHCFMRMPFGLVMSYAKEPLVSLMMLWCSLKMKKSMIETLGAWGKRQRKMVLYSTAQNVISRPNP